MKHKDQLVNVHLGVGGMCLPWAGGRSIPLPISALHFCCNTVNLVQASGGRPREGSLGGTLGVFDDS